MVKSIREVSDFLSKPFLILACSVLSAMMFLVAIDVFLRYFFNHPMPGSYEIVEFMMTLIVPFGIAYCAHKQEHVAVEFIYSRFGDRTQKYVNLITSIFVLVFFLIIAWQNIIYIGQQYRIKFTSSILYIPAYPFVASVAVGFILLCIILLLDLIKYLLEVIKK